MTREQALEAIRALVGPAGCVEDESDRERYERDWRGTRLGRAAAIVRPGSPEQTARVLGICQAARLPVIPQGGNTGLVEGGLPRGDGEEILLSTDRLTRIRWIDAENDAMAVDAGVILADIQAAAAEADRFFPLSLGAEGSCRIGGNLSTNAGGINVLRYGTARALTLGLEVALADGTLWSDMTAVRKDVTGYDLKQLFIGAEGTLGIITGAVLRLFPKPVQHATAFLAMRDAAAAVALLPRLKAATGDRISSFELISQRSIDTGVRYIESLRDPLAATARDWSVLVEVATTAPEPDLDDRLEAALAAEMESGLILDAAVARSEEQRRQIWHLREEVPVAQKHAGGSIRHDVSVPVSQIPEFIERCEALHAGPFPEAVPIFFGHVGDGNLHANFSPRPDAADGRAFLACRPALARAVYDIVDDLGGSISAEHGIGLYKRDDFLARSPEIDLDLMRKIKSVFDPVGILNPGRIF